jgi:tyrosinase
VLWSNAQTIAQTYPLSQQADYVAAATTLRVPYWDWAATPALPNVVTTKSITINTPDGFQEVDNPLYNYTFQTDAAGNGFPSGDPVSSCPMLEASNFIKPSRSVN